jgi:hypothetical protein
MAGSKSIACSMWGQQADKDPAFAVVPNPRNFKIAVRTDDGRIRIEAMDDCGVVHIQRDEDASLFT